MLRDLFSQAYEAMLHNRRRTLITMIGMAWGIATVVLLMAYGAGFGRAIEAIFAQFGTNIMGVFPGTTSEQAGGKKAGVQVKLQLADVDLHRRTASPACFTLSPEVSKDVTVQNDTHSYTWSVNGSYPAIADIQKLDLDYGRFLHRKGPGAAQPRCGDRFGSQDQALFGPVSHRPAHSHQGRELHGHRRIAGQDAGGG